MDSTASHQQPIGEGTGPEVGLGRVDLGDTPQLPPQCRRNHTTADNAGAPASQSSALFSGGLFITYTLEKQELIDPVRS